MKHTVFFHSLMASVVRIHALPPSPLELPSLCSLITCEMVFRLRQTGCIQAASRHFGAGTKPPSQASRAPHALTFRLYPSAQEHASQTDE